MPASNPPAQTGITQEQLDAALSKKADATALASKADTSSLATKADASALASKADVSALAAKADASALASKADVSAIPQPATAAPPAVQVDSAKGDAPRYALENHTHESRLQARRIQVTPDANGRFVYTFPKPYDAGVMPIVEVTAETPTGVTYRNDASILQSSVTNTQVTIIITRLPQSQTVSVLGAVLTLFQPVTTAVWVNIMSRAPS